MLRRYLPEKTKETCRRIRAAMFSVGLGQERNLTPSAEEMDASASVSVVVPIHDSPDVVCRCIRSAEKYGGDAEIVLVDDGSKLDSTLGLIEKARHENPWKIIRHDQPLGHSRACQAGIQASDREYICLLNSDAVLTPWSWASAKKAFESDPTIAVTGPSTSWAATQQAVKRASYCRLYWSDSQINSFAQKYIDSLRSPVWVDLPEISGFAFFVRRSLWQEYGGFDANLPDYGNEAELCRRMVRDGYRLVWTKDSYIHHFGQGTYVKLIGEEALTTKRIKAQQYIDSKEAQ